MNLKLPDTREIVETHTNLECREGGNRPPPSLSFNGCNALTLLIYDETATELAQQSPTMVDEQWLTK